MSKCPVCGNLLRLTLILPKGKQEKICGYWCSYCGLIQDYKHRIVKTEESLQILQKNEKPTEEIRTKGCKMNDRFKFRIFDKETVKYYKSRINKCSGRTLYQHPSSGHCQWVTISTIFAELEQDEKIYTRTGVEPDTIIEQCTGLKDKNGKPIFEGDLIKSPNNSHPLAVYHDITGLWRCKENRPNGIWELPLYDMVRNYTVEIIGNIHEQAEQKD